MLCYLDTGKFVISEDLAHLIHETEHLLIRGLYMALPEARRNQHEIADRLSAEKNDIPASAEALTKLIIRSYFIHLRSLSFSEAKSFSGPGLEYMHLARS